MRYHRSIHPSEPLMRDIRFVVIHTRGPQWQDGVPALEQRGIAQHVEHFRALLDSGKLEMGGPFLDAAAVGMMIPTEGVSEAEMTEFAHADPAVAAGLLGVEIRRWMVGMKK
jgi:uncharacterized protein YciI